MKNRYLRLVQDKIPVSLHCDVQVLLLAGSQEWKISLINVLSKLEKVAFLAPYQNFTAFPLFRRT